jgi:cytochrome c-type biogenesis protein CcmF
MSLAHVGAGVMTLGAIAETAFRKEQAAVLNPGESVDFIGRRVTLLEVGETEGANYTATRANFRVERPGQVQRISAERRFYPTSPMPTTEVGILSGLDGDIYVALGDAGRDNSGWTVRLYYNPLVHLIFIGVTMMALGGMLSLLALSRRRKLAP